MRRAVSQIAGAAIALLVTACSPFRVADMLAPKNGYERETGIAYGDLGRQKLDIYRPSQPNGDDAIIVFIYGGSWRMGNRADYRFVAQPFAAAGYTTVIPDYRLYPQARFPDFVRDIAAALAWIQREMVGKGKPPRIVLVGHSAGAHTAALLALDRRYLEAEGLSPDIIKGWVGLAGPYAFDPIKTKSTTAVFATVRDDVRQAQPLTFARGDAPPALLLHGSSDGTVYPWNSEMLEQAIKAKGGRVSYQPLDNIGHIAIVVSIAKPGLGGAPVLKEIATFIRGL
ncbi:MAG: alpha/beta hydrolase [Proteobacteria bacterium]|nr:alpha/beta hydrolase [Pseudomonadota bacterium]MDA1311637.1 alpha/beta hydrolase [Pseudomonadota bacterium]